MKKHYLSLILSLSFTAFAADQTSTAVSQPAAPAATPVPPPAAPAERSAADLEKLVAPIALYPDPLIATLLTASVYPLEIVQAARFVANTNNLANLDAQPWDENVKAVARVPAVIQKMNEDLSWTMDLGEAFLAQDKAVMDAIQTMRGKAQKAGTLQTTPQQIVIVTNVIVERTIEQQVVVVTNTIVQIQPASTTVVYVPTYNPYTVYYPPPAYVYNPMAPLVTFGMGMAMGAIIANNCDWHHGGCYNNNVNVNINRNVNVNGNVNVNQNVNVNRNANVNSTRSTSATSAQNKWQPDQSRLSKSGAPGVSNSARSPEARGWGSGGAKPSTGSVGARPSTGATGARPSTGTAAARPSTGSTGARPSTGTAPASRPTTSPSASRSSASSPSVSQSRSSPSSSGSAFSGASSASSARNDSSRGSSSRSSSGFSGGRSGGGGGGGGRR